MCRPGVQGRGRLEAGIWGMSLQIWFSAMTQETTQGELQTDEGRGVRTESWGRPRLTGRRKQEERWEVKRREYSEMEGVTGWVHCCWQVDQA